MLEKIASLPESARSAEIKKLSKEELLELADEIIENANDAKYFSTPPNTSAIKNNDVRSHEALLKQNIVLICKQIVERNQGTVANQQFL